MLQELEQAIADRVRLVVPANVARVRTFSETQQKADGRAELIGSIIVGYSSGSFSNDQMPYALTLTFVVISSLKNLRMHQPSLWVVDAIREALMGWIPVYASCSTYTAKGLKPTSERFVELDKEGQLFVWEQTFTLLVSAVQWHECCANPDSSYQLDIIGFYRLANTGLIDVEQKNWKWIQSSNGFDLSLTPIQAQNTVQFTTWQNNALVLVNTPQTPEYIAQDKPLLLCYEPKSNQALFCDTGLAPVLPTGWTLERMSPNVLVSPIANTGQI